MLTNIIVTVVGGLFVAVVYGIFIHHHQDNIRKYLKKQHSGWLKRRYVRLFVEAVRGEGRAYETRLMFQTGLLFPAGILTAIFFTGIWMSEFDLRTANERLSAFDVKMDESDDTKTKDIDTAIEELQTLAKGLKGDREELTLEHNKAKSRVRASRIFFAAAVVWFLWLLIVRQTYVDYRSRFSYELDRFLIRIQGLATKLELAELVRLESKVRGEDTARAYVEKMAAIAKRYKVQDLVETFLLWGNMTASSKEVQNENVES